ncbi:hypothetical protein BD769DRAFT_1772670 [Suillus cothurnatus]|nr:hypothetical protein BD769DRAFT_1772670 [Suillus cothurnatus]
MSVQASATQIGIFNNTPDTISARITADNGDKGSTGFFKIESMKYEMWDRSQWQVAFVLKRSDEPYDNKAETLVVKPTGPLARAFKAIACLESSQTDLSDIGLYYFAIGATLKQIFDSDNNPFSSEESGQIRAIFNSRFREALSEGPTDAPISALYLHPHKQNNTVSVAMLISITGYVNSKLFQKNLNPLALTFVLPAQSAKTMSSESSGPPIQNYAVFSRVLVFLKVLLEGEWKSKENVILKKLTGREAQQSFLRQFERYARGQYPFDTPLGDGQSTLSWWTHLAGVPEGNILATLAVKVFSVRPSSMPEERTMSVFTRMNSALRNRQNVSTLVNMTQIRQWYMYDSASKHPERPTINFYDLDAQLFGSGAKVGKRHHDTRNSLLSTESAGGDEEIEDDESSSWLDNAEESSTTRNDADFDVESEIDMSAEGLLAVLAEASPGGTHKGKGKAKAEEIEGNDNVDNEWPEVWE